MQIIVFTDKVGKPEFIAPAYKMLPMPNHDPIALVSQPFIYGRTQVSPPRADAAPPNLSLLIELPLFEGTNMAASFIGVARAGCYSLHQTLANSKIVLVLNDCLVMARSSFSIDVFALFSTLFV